MDAVTSKEEFKTVSSLVVYQSFAFQPYYDLHLSFIRRGDVQNGAAVDMHFYIRSTSLHKGANIVLAA